MFVMSQASSHLTCRLGLTVSCAVPAFCHGPGIRMYAGICKTLPIDGREVIELKGTTEIVSGFVQS